jgi:putative hydrolase of HD superfamily
VIKKGATQALIDLGRLCLRLGRVDRITYHEDGMRAETDTDHTVMLGVLACAFAAMYLPRLDLGKVAQYALMHDMVEAYAGDTPTLSITPSQRADKYLREGRALERIQAEFHDQFPWVTNTIVNYETQLDAEARFVKGLDKLMPKITHILNEGVTLHREGMSEKDLTRRYATQAAELHRYAADFPELFKLRGQLLDMVYEAVYPKERVS